MRNMKTEPEQQEQEWTPEYVAGLMMASSPMWSKAEWLIDAYRVVADAHNASITAEREKVQKLKQWHEDIAQRQKMSGGKFSVSGEADDTSALASALAKVKEGK